VFHPVRTLVTKKQTKTTPAARAIAQYEADWSPADLDAVLELIDEPAPAYTPTSRVDALRAGIVADTSRHGLWMQLKQYQPLPKRMALGLASSWRRADPSKFGGIRKFDARIVPVTTSGTRARSLVVTGETKYAVAVRYPDVSDTAPVTVITAPAPAQHERDEHREQSW
jgi:hypothetical protein